MIATTTEIHDLAARMLRQIQDDVSYGIVPADVTGFADLHDHVDANGYGDLYDTDYPHDVIDAAQRIVDAAIIAGALTRPTRLLSVVEVAYGQTLLIAGPGNRPGVPTTVEVEDAGWEGQHVRVEGYMSIPAGISQPATVYLDPSALIVVAEEA
jgi:hypothetical protein